MILNIHRNAYICICIRTVFSRIVHIDMRESLTLLKKWYSALMQASIKRVRMLHTVIRISLSNVSDRQKYYKEFWTVHIERNVVFVLGCCLFFAGRGFTKEWLEIVDNFQQQVSTRLQNFWISRLGIVIFSYRFQLINNEMTVIFKTIGWRLLWTYWDH